MKSGMEKAAAFRGRIIVEEYIDGREIKVAILGTQPETVGEVCETFVEDGEVNDYDRKYRSNGDHQSIPAQLHPEICREVKSAAVAVYHRLRCEGLARVYFFLKRDQFL